MRLPAGAQYGDTVSVNNYGTPRIGGGGSRGRLIVQLRVVVPTNLSNKQRELPVLLPMMGDDVASGKKSVTDVSRVLLDDIPLIKEPRAAPHISPSTSAAKSTGLSLTVSLPILCAWVCYGGAPGCRPDRH